MPTEREFYEVVPCLRLRLKDQWLHPLAKARVWLEHERLGALGDFTLDTDGWLVRESVTPLGAYKLHVAAPHLPVAQFRIRVSDTTLECVLVIPAGHLEGRIVCNGGPVPNARLRIFHESESTPVQCDVLAYDDVDLVETDEKGLFRSSKPIGFGMLNLEVSIPAQGVLLRSRSIQHRGDNAGADFEVL